MYLSNAGTEVAVDVQRGAAIVSMRLATGYDPIAPMFELPGSPPFSVRGWQTMFPNAGTASRSGPVRHVDHGDAFAGAWSLTSSTSSTLSIAFLSTVVPLQIERLVSLSASGRSISVDDRIMNLSLDAVEYLYGHHIMLAAPPDSYVRFHDPDDELVELAAVDATAPERFGSFRASGHAQLLDASSERIVDLRWTPTLLSSLWIWQPRHSCPLLAEDALPNGSSGVIGIEPVSASTSGGFAAAREAGELLVLAPKSSRQTRVLMKIQDDESSL